MCAFFISRPLNEVETSMLLASKSRPIMKKNYSTGSISRKRMFV
uniref:Uncharacterized protein n=1 Tax=Rhizophora mucronata TaxID=61149 RepID=A0A2P2Q002_RHIMU